MKKIYLLLLLLLSGYAGLAQDIKFKLTTAANYPILRNEKSEYSSEYYKISTSTNFSQKFGYKLGGSILIRISDKFSVETGVQANRIRFQKSHTWIETITSRMPTMPGFSDPKDPNAWNPFNPIPPSQQASSSPEPTPATTAILYVDLPQVARLSLNSMIQLKAGFTTSLLAVSEQYNFVANANRASSNTETKIIQKGSTTYVVSETNKMQGGSYKKDSSGKGLSKTLFALNAGVALKATEHVALELDYASYLTTLYESSAAKQKYNLFSLGTSYTF